jgi:hypothetical protein
LHSLVYEGDYRHAPANPRYPLISAFAVEDINAVAAGEPGALTPADRTYHLKPRDAH